MANIKIAIESLFFPYPQNPTGYDLKPSILKVEAERWPSLILFLFIKSLNAFL